MQRWTQITAVTVLLLAIISQVGCVKIRQIVTVMPDGSGKIELRFGLSQQMIDLAKETKEDPFKEVLPEAMKDKAQGLAAFTEPTRDKQDDYTYLTYTVYFRDINQVRIDGLGEDEPAQYNYTRQGESAVLTITNGTVLSMTGAYEPTPKDERADVRKAMAGLAFSEHFILPGSITEVAGVQTDANTAKIDLTLDHLLDGTGPIEQLQGKNTLTLTIPQITTEQAAIDAFKKELDAAIAAWQESQQEAE